MATATPTPGGTLIHTPLVDMPGGQLIHTALVHPQTGALIHSSLGLDPNAKPLINTPLVLPHPGALINTGNAMRGALITHLKADEPIRLTPAVQAFLDSIMHTSRGHAVGLGDATGDIWNAAGHIGTPINQEGEAVLGGSMAHPPLQTSPAWPNLSRPRWLPPELMSGGRSVIGAHVGSSFKLDPGELEEIFLGHGNPNARDALIRVLRAGMVKPGTEDN